MNRFCITGLACTWLLCLASLPAAPEPSGTANSINPALLYWQANSLLPAGTPGSAESFRKLPAARVVEQASAHAAAIRLMERAAASTAACDWGWVTGEGELPPLPDVRRLGQAAELTAWSQLEAGRPEAAVTTLSAALALARNTARRAPLVHYSGGVATEGLVVEFIAGNFSRFDAASLQRIAEGLEHPSAAADLAGVVKAERQWMGDSIVAGITAIRAEITRGAGAAPEEIQRQVAPRFPSLGRDDQLREALGDLVASGPEEWESERRNLNACYEAMIRLAEADPDDRARLARSLKTARAVTPNRLGALVIPSFEIVQRRVLMALSRRAMLQAAIAVRLHGPGALTDHPDPLTGEAFRRPPGALQGRFVMRSRQSGDGSEVALEFNTGLPR